MHATPDTIGTLARQVAQDRPAGIFPDAYPGNDHDYTDAMMEENVRQEIVVEHFILAMCLAQLAMNINPPTN